MVKYFVDDEYQGMSMLLSVISLIGILSGVILGIKLKWFRYRMTIPTEESVMLRSHSTIEIRENCSVGFYRQSYTEDSIPISENIASQSTSSLNGNLKTNHREIFRWPFTKNKLSITRNSNKNKENTVYSTKVLSNRQTQNSIIHEKNERIKKNIYERLHSNNNNNKMSTSMPDLVQCDESVVINQEKETENVRTPQSINEAIHKGVEVDLDELPQFVTVDEIKDVGLDNVKVKAKLVIEVPIHNSLEIEKEEIKKEDEGVSMKPPTPMRRKSRSNSLKTQHITNDRAISENQPVVKPRKKNLNEAESRKTLSKENIELLSNELSIEYNTRAKESLENKINTNNIEMTPKSILKMRNESSNQNHNAKTIKFDVPDSFSEEEEPEIDIWKKIDIHRSHVTNKYMIESDDSSSSDSPPPLPKTPPPSVVFNEDRNFIFI